MREKYIEDIIIVITKTAGTTRITTTIIDRIYSSVIASNIASTSTSTTISIRNCTSLGFGIQMSASSNRSSI